jgi:redox-sensitive bicupin YhaK (pirin superfamily)
MIKQVPGKIFLADQRGLVESPHFRRQSTFSFGAYQQAHKEPFGRLYGLNEEVLGGGHEVELPVAQDSYIIVLPITGTVAYSTDGGAIGTVEVGAVLTLSVPAGTRLRLHNPYADELISCLHLWVRASAPLTPLAPAAGLQTVFEELRENELLELVGARAQDAPPTQPDLPFSLSLGRFMGRQEAAYTLAQPGNQLVAFVLAGAFELESRLLHEKDSLVLWDVEAIELEALSNHAIVLLLELTPEPSAT